MNFLHQDELCVVFCDLHPKAPTHLLIVSRKHIPSVADMEEGDEQIVGHMVRTGKNLANELKLAGYKLQINVGRDGGQEIFHLHIHLMSNTKSD